MTGTRKLCNVIDIHKRANTFYMKEVQVTKFSVGANLEVILS